MAPNRAVRMQMGPPAICFLLLATICWHLAGPPAAPVRLAWARVAIPVEEEKAPVVAERVEKYLKPYDWFEVRGLAQPKYTDQDPKGHEEIDNLGPIELVGSSILSTTFFPCTFGFYTREAKLESVKSGPTLHSVIQPKLDRLLEIKETVKYQFNLNRLSPKVNPFDPRRRTIIVIPGYLSTDHMDWMHKIKEAWLELEDVNVILVHWSSGSSNCMYETAVRNTRIVSRQVAILLYYLAQWHNVDFRSDQFRQSLYLVGHSLGAHIAGHLGQELAGQAARITGLDPAGPIYDSMENARHLLGPQDAQLVDIVHTNSGQMSRYYNVGVGLIKKACAAAREKMISSATEGANEDQRRSLIKPRPRQKKLDPNSTEIMPWYGIDKQLGHLDYYVNGGSVQPGCDDQLHVCDHNRAIYVYLRSLEFELAARRAYGNQAQLLEAGLHRLMGFKAKDYEEFRSGASFMLNCPELMVADLTRISANELEQAYKRCTIPIDFVSPIEKLKKELVQEYGIIGNFSELFNASNLTLKGSDEQKRQQQEQQQKLLVARPKYFFDTLPSKPIVSEPYLLRVHLARRPPEWKAGCSFFSHLNSPGPHANLYSDTEFRPKFLLPHQVDKFYGFALPLLNPNDWQLVFPTKRKILSQLNNLLAANKEQQRQQSANKKRKTSFSMIRKLVPNILSIGVSFTSQQPGDSFLARSFDSISSMLSFGSASKPVTSSSDVSELGNDTCHFLYTGFELRPLSRALGASFSLWFASGNSTAKRGQIARVLDHRELVHTATHPTGRPPKLNLGSKLNQLGLFEIGLDEPLGI